MNEKNGNQKINRAIGFPKRRSLSATLCVLLAVAVLFGQPPTANGEGTLAAFGEPVGEAVFLNADESVQLTTTIEGGIQRVVSTMNGSAYEPITVYVGIPVEWTLIAPEGSLNFCNETIMIPEYSLVVELQEGENLIHFMPEQPGTVLFGCWMGMIRSSITVLDENGAEAANLAFGLAEGGQDVISCGICCQ